MNTRLIVGQVSCLSSFTKILESGWKPVLLWAPRLARSTSPTLSPRFRVSAVISFLFCLGAWAQDCAINWHTIDGGGDTSTGGAYAVTSTIGQPDASGTSMSGGQYSLTGGFWALYAAQKAGAPFLTIVPTGVDQATISWTPTSTNWVLQEATGLSATNWMNYSASGSTNPVVVPVTEGTKFYRLFRL